MSARTDLPGEADEKGPPRPLILFVGSSSSDNWYWPAPWALLPFLLFDCATKYISLIASTFSRCFIYFKNTLVRKHGLNILPGFQQMPWRLRRENETCDGSKTRQSAQQKELVPGRKVLRTVLSHLQTCTFLAWHILIIQVVAKKNSITSSGKDYPCQQGYVDSA